MATPSMPPWRRTTLKLSQPHSLSPSLSSVHRSHTQSLGHSHHPSQQSWSPTHSVIHSHWIGLPRPLDLSRRQPLGCWLFHRVNVAVSHVDNLSHSPPLPPSLVPSITLLSLHVFLTKSLPRCIRLILGHPQFASPSSSVSIVLSPALTPEQWLVTTKMATRRSCPHRSTLLHHLNQNVSRGPIESTLRLFRRLSHGLSPSCYQSEA